MSENYVHVLILFILSTRRLPTNVVEVVNFPFSKNAEIPLADFSLKIDSLSLANYVALVPY